MRDVDVKKLVAEATGTALLVFLNTGAVTVSAVNSSAPGAGRGSFPLESRRPVAESIRANRPCAARALEAMHHHASRRR